MVQISNTLIKTNFWEAYPELTIPKAFNNLYSSDKSKDKAPSSKLMWAIALCVHPKSTFRVLSATQRIRTINEDYLKDPNFNWETPEMKTLVSAFKEFCMTKAQRFLVEWESKLDERQAFIANTEFTLATADDLDKMLSRTDKIWDQYRACLKDVEEEDAKGSVRGGATESATEQGML